MEKAERVLFAASTLATAAKAVQRVVMAGGEAVIVTSVAQARAVAGTFDRGLFSFVLRDGSGIVLAAELLLAAKLDKVEFFHPAEEIVALTGPSELRSTSPAIAPAQAASSAA